MEFTKPLISIIILNYNGIKFLKVLFDSLLKTTYSNYEIIMVDNYSTDDSVNFVQKNYPSVKVYGTGKNLGYAGGNNFGIKKANGEIILLLNNDIEVTPNWLNPIIEEFQSDENIAACQPKILQMKNRNYFEYAGASGGFLDIFGYPFLRGRIMDTIEKDEGQYDDNIDLFWASGAAIAIHKKVLEQSGLLDEDFFLHMEEIDLCWRILLQGKRIRVCTDSIIYHFGGGSLQQGNFKKIYFNHRNSVFMMLKNYSTHRLLYLLPVRIALDKITFLKGLITFDTKLLKSLFMAYKWLIINFKLIMKKRKIVQQNRKVKDKALDKLFYHKSVALGYFLFNKRTYKEIWK